MTAIATAHTDMYETHVYPFIDKWMQWYRRENEEVRYQRGVLLNALANASGKEKEGLIEFVRQNAMRIYGKERAVRVLAGII